MNRGLINGGFFCFQREFLNYLDDSPGCTLERAPLERCAAEGNLCVFEHRGFWQCMDTYRDWQSLEAQWQDGNAPWKVWDRPSEFPASEVPERWARLRSYFRQPGCRHSRTAVDPPRKRSFQIEWSP